MVDKWGPFPDRVADGLKEPFWYGLHQEAIGRIFLERVRFWMDGRLGWGGNSGLLGRPDAGE